MDSIRNAVSLFSACVIGLTFITPTKVSSANQESVNADLSKMSGWNRSVVGNGDVKLEIFQKGEGVAVLMHPSLGRPAQDFEDLGNRVVAAGFHVVLINPRGIGGSIGPMENVTLRDLGADVWMVADTLKIDRAFILGQNFGNRVSRTVSSLQPSRVIGLMLLAAGGEIPMSKETAAELQRVFAGATSGSRFEGILRTGQRRQRVEGRMVR